MNSLSKPKAAVILSLRLGYAAVREFMSGHITLRAMSLVYTTLLSLVPFLAVSFSVLKAFGVQNKIEPTLYNFLAPLGPEAGEITARVIGFVNNMKVGVLGSIGLAMLIYTVISLIQKMEESFNAIWKVKSTRSLMRRFSDYLSIILIGPVLVFSAIAVTASLMSSGLVQKLMSYGPVGLLIRFAGGLLPYLLVCAAFTFIYIFVPNTTVRFKSGAVGGISAGILWETAGWGFASFIATSGQYAAIYSGFAILVLFMIWLYLNWVILLMGSLVSFYHQHPHLLTRRKDPGLLGGGFSERKALFFMFYIGYNFYHGREPWNLNSLVAHLGLDIEQAEQMIDVLKKKKLISETADDPPAFLPARAPDAIYLKDILDAVRLPVREEAKSPEEFGAIEEVTGIAEKIEKAIADSLGKTTLRDIVLHHTKEIPS